MLAEQHPLEKIKDMACDVRIAIATHGAVWSHRMDIAAKTLGQDSETEGVDSRSATTKDSYYNKIIFQRVINSVKIITCILYYLYIVYTVCQKYHRQQTTTKDKNM